MVRLQKPVRVKTEKPKNRDLHVLVTKTVLQVHEAVAVLRGLVVGVTQEEKKNVVLGDGSRRGVELDLAAHLADGDLKDLVGVAVGIDLGVEVEELVPEDGVEALVAEVRHGERDSSSGTIAAETVVALVEVGVASGGRSGIKRRVPLEDDGADEMTEKKRFVIKVHTELE